MEYSEILQGLLLMALGWLACRVEGAVRKRFCKGIAVRSNLKHHFDTSKPKYLIDIYVKNVSKCPIRSAAHYTIKNNLNSLITPIADTPEIEVKQVELLPGIEKLLGGTIQIERDVPRVNNWMEIVVQVAEYKETIIVELSDP